MSRYIDLDALGLVPLIQAPYPFEDSYIDGYNAVVRQLELAPVADVRPIVHGRWETREHKGMMIAQKCTACDQKDGTGAWWVADHTCSFKYCPCCGAKMDLYLEEEKHD